MSNDFSKKIKQPEVEALKSLKNSLHPALTKDLQWAINQLEWQSMDSAPIDTEVILLVKIKDGRIKTENGYLTIEAENLQGKFWTWLNPWLGIGDVLEYVAWRPGVVTPEVSE